MRNCFTTAFVLCVVAVSAAQANIEAGHVILMEPPPILTGCGQLPTFAGGSDITPAERIMDEPLVAHMSAAGLIKDEGIALTRPALLEALNNQKPKIRALAGWQLADETGNAGTDDPLKLTGVEEAVRRSVADALWQAIAVEHYPETKIYLTCALAQIGDQRGLQALRSDCDDTTLPTDWRVYVAFALLELADQSHVADALNPTWGQTCSPAAVAAMPDVNAGEVLAQYYIVSPGQYPEVRSLLLARDDGRILQDVLNFIRNVPDIAAIPDLESALSRQKDEISRGEIESVMKVLHYAPYPAPTARNHVSSVYGSKSVSSAVGAKSASRVYGSKSVSRAVGAKEDSPTLQGGVRPKINPSPVRDGTSPSPEKISNLAMQRQPEVSS